MSFPLMDFLNKGIKTVFFCRFVPVVRSLISIPAGMSEMSIGIFIIYTTLGSLLWNTVLICIGAFAGNKIEVILSFIDRFSNILLIGIIALCLVKIYRKKTKIEVVKKFGQFQL